MCAGVYSTFPEKKIVLAELGKEYAPVPAVPQKRRDADLSED